MSKIEQPHILIVEDDDDLANGLRGILEDAGYQVARAANGVQALFALDGKLRPAVIILDLMMPVMDGATFRARQLERHGDVAGIPVIGWSAFGGRFTVDFEVVPKKAGDVQRLLARIREIAGPPPRAKPAPRISTRRLGIIAALVASAVTLLGMLLDHWPFKKGKP